MKNINDLINDLSPERRARVKARTEQLIGEEMALQHLRKARSFTQARIAEALDIGQDSVSRMESRADLLMSTLESYVEAMGGRLRLLVEFPDGIATLSTTALATMDETKPAPDKARKKTPKVVHKSKLQLAHAND